MPRAMTCRDSAAFLAGGNSHAAAESSVGACSNRPRHFATLRGDMVAASSRRRPPSDYGSEDGGEPGAALFSSLWQVAKPAAAATAFAPLLSLLAARVLCCAAHALCREADARQRLEYTAKTPRRESASHQRPPSPVSPARGERDRSMRRCLRLRLAAFARCFRYGGRTRFPLHAEAAAIGRQV